MKRENVLVDSDILIDFFRTGTGLLPELIKQQDEGEIEIYVSSMTVFELFSGQSSKSEKEKILQLLEDLKIIPFDRSLAQFAGGLNRDLHVRIPLADFIIGATCLYLDAKLATRNKSHFQDIGKIRYYR